MWHVIHSFWKVMCPSGGLRVFLDVCIPFSMFACLSQLFSAFKYSGRFDILFFYTPTKFSFFYHIDLFMGANSTFSSMRPSFRFHLLDSGKIWAHSELFPPSAHFKHTFTNLARIHGRIASFLFPPPILLQNQCPPHRVPYRK